MDAERRPQLAGYAAAGYSSRSRLRSRVRSRLRFTFPSLVALSCRSSSSSRCLSLLMSRCMVSAMPLTRSASACAARTLWSCRLPSRCGENLAVGGWRGGSGGCAAVRLAEEQGTDGVTTKAGKAIDTRFRSESGYEERRGRNVGKGCVCAQCGQRERGKKKERKGRERRVREHTSIRSLASFTCCTMESRSSSAEAHSTHSATTATATAARRSALFIRTRERRSERERGGERQVRRPSGALCAHARRRRRKRVRVEGERRA